MSVQSVLITTVCLVFIFTFTKQIHAATYIVDRADDVTATACTATANDCSLGGAIINANANGTGADVIQFNINISAPTSSSVNVSGRVTSGNRGYRAVVSITDSNGIVHTVLTNPFGYYRFTEVPAGETYIINVNHKRYQFNPSLQILTIVEDTENINFTTQE